MDLDFPIVYRSVAGIDSIAQAAGRCNRNGCQSSPGTTFVFHSEHRDRERFLRETTDVTAQIMECLGSGGDLLGLDAVEEYFRLYYWSQETRWDSEGILEQFRKQQRRSFPFLFSYETVANRFRLIQEHTKPVIIPWRETGRALCRELRLAVLGPSRRLLRQLQRFTVQIPTVLWNNHIQTDIQHIGQQYPVLMSPQLHYLDSVGLSLESEGPGLWTA